MGIRPSGIGDVSQVPTNMSLLPTAYIMGLLAAQPEVPQPAALPVQVQAL